MFNELFKIRKLAIFIGILCFIPFFLQAYDDCNLCFDTSWTWPITSDYGPRNVGTWFHEGMDFGVPRNEGIKPVEEGVIAEIIFNALSGFYGMILNLPYCLKCLSKEKAVLIFNFSIMAKLIQSVKLNFLSLYLHKISRACFSSSDETRTILAKRSFSRLVPISYAKRTPRFFASKVMVSSMT